MHILGVYAQRVLYTVCLDVHTIMKEYYVHVIAQSLYYAVIFMEDNTVR